jgi:uncharacterized protein YacL
MADSDIIIPKVVLRELQLLADGRDAHKRERARAGLEAAGELQEEFAERCVLDSFGFGTKEKTDELLLQITANRNARLCTTDYNLNQVAIVEKIAVLNVNELAQVMRPKILPGETITVKILQKGESPGQGVGYLEDGTMAVVDNTTPKMKNTFVVAKVERMIQTKARDITGPGIYQFTYVSSLAETATLTVTVSDSALYEAQDAIDVPFELPVIVPTTYLPTRNVVALDRPRVAVAMAT